MDDSKIDGKAVSHNDCEGNKMDFVNDKNFEEFAEHIHYIMETPLTFCGSFIAATERMPSEHFCEILRGMFKDWLRYQPEDDIRKFCKMMGSAALASRRINKPARDLPIYGGYMATLIELPDQKFENELRGVFKRWINGADEKEVRRYMLSKFKIDPDK